MLGGKWEIIPPQGKDQKCLGLILDSVGPMIQSPPTVIVNFIIILNFENPLIASNKKK